MGHLILRFFIILTIPFFPLLAENSENKHDILYSNLIGAALITAWGATFWDYGKSSPHTTSEGWFGENTKYGGADKIGHLYASYVLGTGLCELYKNFGYDEKHAITYGSLSS
ncbi:MAG TPA: DUF2279 domain-containing protein, partial [Sulfuricurvum sp.]|nr:DUF2279 domain-containing protein [Sulfuricurvum sp.]